MNFREMMIFQMMEDMEDQEKHDRIIKTYMNYYESYGMKMGEILYKYDDPELTNDIKQELLELAGEENEFYIGEYGLVKHY